MQLKHFEQHEFDCKCGCGLGINNMDKDLLIRLDEARSIAASSFTITSAIRCKKHNSAIGGSKNSSHLSGHAVDIACSRDDQRWKIIDALMKVGFSRIGISNDFIHVDNDQSKNSKRIWTY